ncbi:uncharacterized protein BKA78DRAFT_302725 [Phyllosticta capitalensis]|uniref:uncharacterized protein n=1 Tax=Phyllosticta capitalensis TaxID=121624 RepID=UPI0031313906
MACSESCRLGLFVACLLPIETLGGCSFAAETSRHVSERQIVRLPAQHQHSTAVFSSIFQEEAMSEGSKFRRGPALCGMIAALREVTRLL